MHILGFYSAKAQKQTSQESIKYWKNKKMKSFEPTKLYHSASIEHIGSYLKK